MVEALDRFIAGKLRALAPEINARPRKELDDKALDQVQQENKKLDEFKNRFLPSFGEAGGGDGEGKGPGQTGLDLQLGLRQKCVRRRRHLLRLRLRTPVARSP